MKFEIKKRFSGLVIFSVEADSFKRAVESAVKQKSDLRYSDLRYSNLRYSDLRGSDLRYSDLSGSDLRYSDLRGSDLSGSDLRYSDLRGSDLNFSSHDLVAEILKQAAGNDVEKLRVAGLVLIKKDWCWKNFLGLEDPLKDWALNELKKWVTDKTDPQIKKILLNTT